MAVGRTAGAASGKPVGYALAGLRASGLGGVVGSAMRSA